MADWMTKRMAHPEWGKLQDALGAMQLGLHHGGKVKMRMRPAGTFADDADIYVSTPAFELAERMSPGGWSECSEPEGELTVLID